MPRSTRGDPGWRPTRLGLGREATRGAIDDQLPRLPERSVLGEGGRDAGGDGLDQLGHELLPQARSGSR